MHGLIEHDAAGGDEDRPGIVHRLDRDTSGLLVVARSDEAHERLQEAIRRRLVERRYLALVKGTLRSRSGRIEAPIGRDRTDKSRHSLDTPTPREAVTRFEVAGAARPAGAARRHARDRAARTRSASISRRSTCRSAATRSTASSATSASSGSSCTRRGSRSTTRSPRSGSTSSRRCPRTSPPRSSAPASWPDSTLAATLPGSFSLRPGDQDGWGCQALSRFRPRPAGCIATQPRKGPVPWQSYPCVSSWKPESTSATRPAAGIRR